MMRIAKIADDDGSADGGIAEAGGADTTASDCGRGNGAGAGGGGAVTGRANAGLDTGRGGNDTGRGAGALDFSVGSATKLSAGEVSLGATIAGSDGERSSDRSEGERAVAGAAPWSLSAATSEGFERWRGIGGGALSGGAEGVKPEPGTGGNAGTLPASSSGAPLALGLSVLAATTLGGGSAE